MADLCKVKHMTRQPLLAICALSLLAIGTVANAEPVTMPLNQVISGGTPDGTSPWLTATFTQGSTADSVELVLSASGLAGADFVGGVGGGKHKNPDIGWGFNFSGNVGGLTFGCTDSAANNCADAINTSGTTIGHGLFGNLDFAFAWGPHDRFGAGDTADYTITSSGALTPADFFVQNDDGWYSVAHIQNISGGCSAFIGYNGSSNVPSGTPGDCSHIVTPVPEPGDFGLFLLGLVGAFFGYGRLRRGN